MIETKRNSILIVDDENSNIIALTQVLSPLYTVYAAKNGHQALRAAEKFLPDIILLDVVMPDMNGFEVLRRLKSNAATAPIPVIFLSAKSDSISEFEGLSLGAKDYVSKPFSPPILLKRIELHLLIESQSLELNRFNAELQTMVDEKTNSVVELKDAILKMMAELVEYRDNITGNHIERTMRYMSIMLEAVLYSGVYEEEISTWDIVLVLRSAQLHDIGKIAIPDIILKKPGTLTVREFDQIRLHPAFGEKIIERIMLNTREHAFLEYAKIFTGTHHEKWDGSGYPRGMKGEEIPLQGRLMAFADVYDALTSERPYKKAFTHEEAIAIIAEESGKHFDPALVDVFMSCSEEFRDVLKTLHHPAQG